MSSRVPSYLRTARRSWGLTQREMARLIGTKSRTHISRLERGERSPSVESLIACLVLFGATASELFPYLYSHIEETVLRNAARLLEELDGDTSLRGRRKRALLERALRRAISSSSTKGV
jgi:transcriptional regulator with XRE-family HTH domain